jgi:hypothetical protein
MTFDHVVANIVNMVNSFVIPIIFTLSFVFFLINIVKYFFIEDGEEAKEKGRKAVLFGLMGLAVLFSVWGLINIFLNTLTSALGTPPV